MLLCGDHTVTSELVLLRQDRLVAPSFRDGFTSVSSITHGTTVRDLGQHFNPANLGHADGGEFNMDQMVTVQLL